MNFENIKKLMDDDDMKDAHIPNSLSALKGSNMPIQKIRKTMKKEIATQLSCIIIFFIAPSFVAMYNLPKAVYYIFMFVTCLITLGYLAKMTWFLSRTSTIQNDSKGVVVSFVNDLKLTLEVYKTAIISGSLLLPIPMLALSIGAKANEKDLFSDIFLLNVSGQTLLLYVCGYILSAFFIYFITVFWTNSVYGVHIKKLEDVLEQFDV